MNFVYLSRVLLLLIYGTLVSTIKAQEDVIITNSKLEITFDLGSNLEPIAEYSYEICYHYSGASDFDLSKVIFFDTNSKIKNLIKRSGNKMKVRKIEPVITDYQSEGIFHSDLKLMYFEHRFENENDQVCFSYIKETSDVRFIDPIYFHDAYKTDIKKVTLKVPKWLDLRVVEMNFDKTNVEIDVVKSKNKYEYNLNELPKAFSENYEPNRSKIYPHLILVPQIVKKGSKSKKIFSDVGDLYSWYSDLVSSMNNNNSKFNGLVANLIKGKNSDLEKIKSIYYWVQDHVRYVAFEYGIMGFKPENCQSVYGNKFGDCKGMANLTKEMLKIAGYDARLTWIGTTDLPYDYSIPSLMVDNHMICTVILNDKKYFLDPTEKYGDFGKNAGRLQGKQVLIEDQANFILDSIPFNGGKDHSYMFVGNFNLEFDQLVGEANIKVTGDQKTKILNSIFSLSETDRMDFVRNYAATFNKNHEIQINDYPKVNYRDKDFKLKFEMTKKNSVVDLGSEIYVNLEVGKEFGSYIIDKERKSAVEISNPVYIENVITLNIPEDWKTNYIPTNLKIHEDNYIYELNFKRIENTIVYNKILEIKDGIILKKDFSKWNKHIKQLTEKYEDPIILSKK